MLVSDREAEQAATTTPTAVTVTGLTPTAAWSRGVRWIGELIQAAFAAFWLHAKKFREAFAGFAADGKTPPRGARKNPLQFGAILWYFRHDSGVTSPPVWVQNLILSPLWLLAKVFGVRRYYDRWDSFGSSSGRTRALPSAKSPLAPRG
jgi:hypothetical protein